MPEVVVLQHITCENPGTIRAALAREKIGARYILTSQEPVPAAIPAGVSGLIVMGGPMGVYESDQYAFLSDEMRLIGDAVNREIPVLGVCLGAQLMAAALGAEVKPGPQKEIGWYPVQLTDAATIDPAWKKLPREFMAFHWHGDRFDLPSGAELLASSGLTPNQAFRYGKSAYGIQFHLEVDHALVAAMAETFSDELAAERIPVSAILEPRGRYLPALEAAGRVIFDDWVRSVMLTASQQP